MIDGVDVSDIITATNSTGYRLIVERIKSIHAAKLRELRDSAKTHDETQALRGFLDGLDRCLSVPDTLRTEYEAKVKARK